MSDHDVRVAPRVGCCVSLDLAHDLLGMVARQSAGPLDIPSDDGGSLDMLDTSG